mgnify:CR=1 FL=1
MKLNSAVSAVVFAVLALGVSACGGLSPLTAEQKAIVKETGRSAVASRSAAPGVGAYTNLFANSVSAFAPGAPGTDDSSSESTDSVRFRTALAAADCKEDTTTSTASGKVPFVGSGFKVSGPKCPIAMEMKFESTSSEAEMENGNIKLKLALTYEVLDAELRKLNDVDQFNLKIDVDMQVNKKDGSGRLTAKLEGDLHSQKYDKLRFKLEVSGSMNAQGQANGQFVVRYDFKDFTAEGRVELANDGTTKYSVNGETATSEEFFELMTAGRPVSAPGSSGSSQAPSRTPSRS